MTLIRIMGNLHINRREIFAVNYREYKGVEIVNWNAPDCTEILVDGNDLSDGIDTHWNYRDTCEDQKNSTVIYEVMIGINNYGQKTSHYDKYYYRTIKKENFIRLLMDLEIYVEGKN